MCVSKPFAGVASGSPKSILHLHGCLFIVSVVYFIANRRDRTRLIFGYGLVTLKSVARPLFTLSIASPWGPIACGH